MVDLLKLSKVAEQYYNARKKKALPSGWEKYVCTDGQQSMFVKSDYTPLEGQAVYYLFTRNFQTVCQFYKNGDDMPGADLEQEDEPGPQYEIAPLPNLMWQVTDYYHHIVIKFHEGLFYETQEVTTPPNLSQEDILNTPKWLRELGEWVALNHDDEACCDTDTRQSVLALLNKEQYWFVIAAALNGIATDLWGEDEPANEYLMAEVGEYIAEYTTPWLMEEDANGLMDALENLDHQEALDVCKIVRAYWESNRNAGEWARDLLWWGAYLPADKRKA